VAGVPGAISSVPDGMAAGILAGVSPVHGLYAGIVGPIGGGLTSSSRLMVITATTSAAALAAGSAVAGVPAERRAQALFLLTVPAGALMVVAALLRLGRFTRFVPHSVMIGFLTGVAVNIVLGQQPDLTGSDVSGEFALAKAWHLLLDPRSIGLPSLAAGLGALGSCSCSVVRRSAPTPPRSRWRTATESGFVTMGTTVALAAFLLVRGRTWAAAARPQPSAS
jgi:SulP family sulfate permease